MRDSIGIALRPRWLAPQDVFSLLTEDEDMAQQAAAAQAAQAAAQVQAAQLRAKVRNLAPASLISQASMQSQFEDYMKLQRERQAGGAGPVRVRRASFWLG